MCQVKIHKIREVKNISQTWVDWSWLNWNTGADRDGMTKSQLKNSIVKFRKYYEAKREVGPNKTS